MTFRQSDLDCLETSNCQTKTEEPSDLFSSLSNTKGMAYRLSNGVPESKRIGATDCAFYLERADCRQPAEQYGPLQRRQEAYNPRGVNFVPLNLNIPPAAALLSPGPGLWSGSSTEQDAYSGGSPETPACYSDVDPDQKIYASQHTPTPVIYEEYEWSNGFKKTSGLEDHEVHQGLGIAPNETLNDPALSLDGFQSIPATLGATEGPPAFSDVRTPSLFRADAHAQVERSINPMGYLEAPQSRYPQEAIITDEEDNGSMGGDTDDRESEYHPSGSPSSHTISYSKGTFKGKAVSATSKRPQRTKATQHSPAVTHGRVTKRSAPKATHNITSPRSTKSAAAIAAAAKPRLPHSCPDCTDTFASPSSLTKHTLAKHRRPFTCIFARYGCAAVFGSKNEWTRHVRVQHLMLELWRCNLGKCGIENNASHRAGKPLTHDFHRKDLFTQHARRMHRDVFPRSTDSVKEEVERAKREVALQKAAHLCLRNPPPRSLCTFCREKGVFESWELRMEHVGRHLEQGDGLRLVEAEDMLLKGWMMAQGLLASDEVVGYRLAGCDGRRGRGSKRAMKQVRVVDVEEEVDEEEEEEEEDGEEGEDVGEADAEGEDDADFQHQ